MKASRFGFYQSEGWNGFPVYLAALRVGPLLELQMFTLKDEEWAEIGARFSYAIGETRAKLIEHGDARHCREVVRGALEAEIMMTGRPINGRIDRAHELSVQGVFVPQKVETLAIFKPELRVILGNGEGLDVSI